MLTPNKSRCANPLHSHVVPLSRRLACVIRNQAWSDPPQARLYPLVLTPGPVLVSRYFARLGRNAISIYECPEMNLLDKKSYKLESVHDFEWSPAEPIICAYQTEQASGNLPARVSLIKIPERIELRQKNLFSVSGVFHRASSPTPVSLALLGVLLVGRFQRVCVPVAFIQHRPM